MTEFDRGYLEEVFGDGGHLARASATYRKRAGQIAMASAIHDAIATDEPLVVEAATGTGKSLAYLVPAIWAVTDPKMKAELIKRRTVDEEKPAFHGSQETCEESPRVLVVTAGLNLQDQLTRKDLPFLQRVLPWSFRFEVAKGRSNYACLSRIHSTTALEVNETDDGEWADVNRWLGYTHTGDLAELPFEIRPSIRRHVSVSADECHGNKCAHHEACFSALARERAGSAEVVVVNFHLLLSHLAVTDPGERTSILPRYDVIVLDEVHELPAIARKFLGSHVHPGLLKEPLKLLTGSRSLATDVEREVDAFFGAVSAYRRSGSYQARLKEAHVFAHEPLTNALERLAERLQRQASALDPEENELANDHASREQVELRRAAQKVKEHAKHITEACCLEDAERTVYFIQEERVLGRDRCSLAGEPIDPAPLLRALLWRAPEPKPGPDGEVKPKRHLPVSIGASATLSTQDDGGEKGVGFMTARLGAEEARRLVLRTPFNISKQVLTCYPRESPDAKAKDYPERLAPLFVRAIRMSRGRALGLFTSRHALNVVTEIVRRELGDEYPILKQGEAPRPKLVERFRADIPSCLFGVKSFWAGVDVPGEALSLVLIDRIPFDPPDDPVMDALSMKDSKVFLHHAVPRAAIELRQAFGRLIRSETDRGVVVLFDRRFMSTGWGKLLVQAMPSTSVTMDLDEIARFFKTDVAR
jgi:ATP-dependent DNA helicase DinG